jgi:glycogen debranching enzyme
LKPDFNKNIEITIPIHQAGAFAFYFTYTPLPEFAPWPVSIPKPTKTETHYIDVCPRVQLAGAPLPLDAISVISCLSKFMGKYPDDWEKHLHGISERGYNMIHFTPLMIRGESNSPYSIYDQLTFDPKTFPGGEKDIQDLVYKMESDYGLLGMTDVVWNHTANNSEWLQYHPEAGYNIKTSPHLEPALELDTALLRFGDSMAALGYPTIINSLLDLDRIMDGIEEHCLKKLKLWQYFVMDVDFETQEVIKAWKDSRVEFPRADQEAFGERGLSDPEAIRNWAVKQKASFIIDRGMTGLDRLGERYRRKVIPSKVAAFLSVLVGRYDTRTLDSPDETKAESVCRELLNEINMRFFEEWDIDRATILEQLKNRIKYVRWDDHGPKLGAISKASPLIESYFTRLPRNAVTKKYDPGVLALVNNGWVWAADAMRDNAGPQSKAYLKREVIVWGDCTKLRYGSGPQDNPWLWDHMAKYTRLMAKYFAGFRIDNCHSTPLPLAEYMLDQARCVRPDLVVCAELFSGSEEMDFVFCKRLGLSCLIREAMQAWNTQELSRVVHRHAGIPIGSFETDEVVNAKIPESNGVNGVAGKRETIRTIKQSPVHALFMDCTHDNQPPTQKRDARDTLPNAALVAMCACATGSVFGYDECYPELIELVHETRPYSSPYSNDSAIKIQSAEGGIGNIKKLMNQIHILTAKDGYSECFIHHDKEYITIHRVQPQSRRGYFLIAHTAFPGYGNGNGGFEPTKLPGTRAKCIGAWMFEADATDENKKAAIEDKILRGIPSRTREIRDLTCEWKNDETIICIPEKFPPGSIAIFETWIPGAEHSEGLEKFICRGAGDACKDLSLTDLNFLLYRADPEERDLSNGTDGTYNIPGHGSLVYAGLQGWWSVLRDIIHENNLGHPICDHLRSGNWALDYTFGRLEKVSKQTKFKKLTEPATWLRDRFTAIKKLPSFLMPRYFAMVIQTLYNAATDRAIELMAPIIRNGNSFLQGLSLVSIQVVGNMNSTSLWPDKSVACMAAGLPHFANDWARCWGRDIMIAMRGLLISTERYKDAKEHICAFASVLKHGMIPNLLSSGQLPRYNARDSIWFFHQVVQDYCNLIPNGHELLQESVKRRFLAYDDTWFPHDDKRAYSTESTMEDVIQESMQRHASGIDFREYNAGPNIDSQMRDEGFNLHIWVDPKTGFIHGGNQYNCGTWMDKMGESTKAGNKGVPGTPRDGAAVEITGMLYSTCAWLSSMYSDGKFKYEGVKWQDGNFKSYADWAALIKANFERCFYIPRDKGDDSLHDVQSNIVNRRGIYKDLYKSGKPYEDYQLRPNFPIAMCVAPDLFEPEHARHALWMADKYLVGPIGMRTLDPSDLNYRPNYINSDDSSDFHTAKGRNYHQGPEWVWPMGYFLRAMLRFDLMHKTTSAGRTESYQQVTKRLAGCMEQLKTSEWAGLTELTNKDGAFCADSCPTQAWSAGCLIDLFDEATREENATQEVE